MITGKLFRKHYAISAAVLAAFIAIGFVLSNALLEFTMRQSDKVVRERPGPAPFFARLIDEMGSAKALHPDRVATLAHLAEMDPDGPIQRMSILDENGRNLSTGAPLPFDWKSTQLPVQPYQFTRIVGPRDHERGPHGPQNEGIVRFPGEPAQYLFAAAGPHGPLGGRPPGPPPNSRILFFSLTFGFLAISVLTGLGVALKLIYRSVHEKALLADKVIAELQQGNLKARFPIERRDETSEAMLRFNRMADEIERLVERLRSTERSRISLLQDLTHDLRTPIASMKNLLVTVEKKTASEDQPLRVELLSLAQREVDYFERLVEDLLTLAQVSEPGYRPEQRRFSLLEVLEDEIAAVSGGEQESKRIEIRCELAPARCELTGDQLLLRRLFRNALENAYSFARELVLVEVTRAPHGELEIAVRDDGPGLSESALQGFGERRVSRVLDREKNHRLSVGLGSVIMKTVTTLHRGSLVASNLPGPDGRPAGAEIRITLPGS